ncbi:hypothetical protein SZMC14600_11908 [Saccharomonospora azurea SZMC 14600]|uniref:hypothetical protein n=1 Tax=Saccharomonospora azurea TaxID=40988 RepID=UPI00023FF67E|nr:hypothetical protein SZMC14600_11908 [Saccharomonospora azurea SZMC 14600]
MGLLLLLVFFVAVVFLIRSMTKHLKRVPASFDHLDDADGRDEGGRENTTPDSAGVDAASGADSGGGGKP